MSRVCQITGKRPLSGNNVSHAHNTTRRKFMPNLQKRRFWSEKEQKHISLRVSTQAIRLIDKKGLDLVLESLRNQGQKI